MSAAQLTKIAPKLQPEVIHVYWMLMMEAVSKYEAAQYEYQKQGRDPSMADPILRIQIEGSYRLWNEMTGDNAVPKWLKNQPEA